MTIKPDWRVIVYYDYLIVGAGLFGAVFAREMTDSGKKCLIIDRRDHIAGNIFTKNWKTIDIHWYGPHIFHTSDERVWEYVNRYAEFNDFINSPVAVYKNELYNLPFNMNTFVKLWGVKTPDEAKEIIASQIADLNIDNPSNLEEQALSLVGTDVYEKLIKGYSEKQWGRDCRELPSFIIKRLPLRFVYDNNYYDDKYQGVPIGGYTKFVEKLTEGIEIRLDTEYKSFVKENKTDSFGKIVYTGMIDEFFDYRLGELEYRTVRFEHEYMEGCENYQGNAVVNYTEREIPYTRIIEHKHFDFGKQNDTVVSKEYPAAWKSGDEPYYPINDARNTELYGKYCELAQNETNVIFGGRLGQYRYYDMDEIIAAALDAVACERR